jgi:putative membrane fusion protein
MKQKVVKFPARKKFKIGRFLVIVVLVMALFYGAKLVNENRLKTIQTDYGYLEDTVTTEGIVVRNELVVKSPVTGQATYMIDSPRRVRSGEAVVSITKPSVDLLFLKNRIVEIDNRIEQFKNNESEPLTKKVEEQLDAVMEELKDSIAKGDFESVDNQKQRLISIAKQNEAFIGNGYVDPLEAALLEKQQIQAELKEGEIELIAPFAGMINFKTDGLEEVLLPQNLTEVRPEQLLNTEINIVEIPLNTKETRIGEPVFKIIDNFEFYIVTDLPKQVLENKTEGSFISLYIDENPNPVLFKIDTLIPRDKDNLLILKTNQDVPELYSQRKVDIRIVESGKWGIIIPKTAVVEKDDVMGVMIKSGGNPVFKKIEILGENDGRVVVDGIGRMEEIILNPDR